MPKPAPQSALKKGLNHPVMARVAAGIVAIVGGGTTAFTYQKAESSDMARVRSEQKVADTVHALDAGLNDVKQHIDDHDKYIRKLDRRTTRMEVMQELMLGKQGIRPPPRTDKDE